MNFNFFKSRKPVVTYFSSEHVSPGHPDKVMDTIAEAIVDWTIDHSTSPRVAVDGLVKNNWVVLAGEITSDEHVPFSKITRDVIRNIGYTKDACPDFNDENVFIKCLFTQQSPDIAQGVDHDLEKESAGDIGIMFGGAVNEAPDYTCWSHYLARYLSYMIYNKKWTWARPDQKTQVTIKYVDGKPVGIENIVVCISHDAAMPQSTIYHNVMKYIYKCLNYIPFPKGFDYQHFKLDVNPTGAFSIFGPKADSGEVGRKIVCDQYGGYFPVGGGNLNGKDGSKVDRSAVYMARYVAKQIVAKGLADKCQIQVAYAIGKLEPVSIDINCFGTNKVSMEDIQKFVSKYSFIPGDIIKLFDLKTPYKELGGRKFTYQSLGSYGHIGTRFEGIELPWEVVEP